MLNHPTNPENVFICQTQLVIRFQTQTTLVPDPFLRSSSPIPADNEFQKKKVDLLIDHINLIIRFQFLTHDKLTKIENCSNKLISKNIHKPLNCAIKSL